MDSGELLLDTDASDCGIGAVISPVQGGEERVLAYGQKVISYRAKLLHCSQQVLHHLD